MKELNIYIYEKLVINKDIKLDEETYKKITVDIVYDLLDTRPEHRTKSFDDLNFTYRWVKDVYDWVKENDVVKYEIYVNRTIDKTLNNIIEDPDKVNKYRKYFKKSDICFSTPVVKHYKNKKGIFHENILMDYNHLLLKKL